MQRPPLYCPNMLGTGPHLIFSGDKTYPVSRNVVEDHSRRPKAIAALDESYRDDIELVGYSRIFEKSSSLPLLYSDFLSRHQRTASSSRLQEPILLR